MLRILILGILFPFILPAQLSCDISTSNDTIVCGPQILPLKVTGEIYDVLWSPDKGLSQTDETNITATVSETTMYHVINKRKTDNVIVNGEFSEGTKGFTNDYVIDCPNNKFSGDLGTWKEGAPNDGQYCVAPATSFAFSLGGWQACTEHTGDGVGMMYVNGDVTPDAKIWCQSLTVETETDYQFSTWIASVYNGNPARLAFSINGEIIGDPFVAEKETCIWKEFFEIWDSGLNTTAEICIVNQNTQSNGNDFVLDDITFNEVCVDYDSVLIEVKKEIEVDLGEDKVLCPGDSVQISAVLEPGNNILWNTNNTEQNIIVKNAGQYIIEVKDNLGCSGRDTVIVAEVDTPYARFPEDTIVCFFLSSQIELRAQDEAQQYSWSTGSESQAVLITEPGGYSIEMFNSGACYSSDTIKVLELCDASSFFVPNTFTPNNDGFNEGFRPKGENIFEYEMRIYNRWGQKLFYTENLQTSWDGTFLGRKAPIGVYVYKIDYTGISPENSKAYKKTVVGTVNLLR